jgi:HlyD family secretion protein
VAYAVRLGISDGVATELIVSPGSPDAAVLKEGADVIVAVLNAGAPSTPARAGGMAPRPPF